MIEKFDLSKFRKLDDVANRALFDLHDYLRVTQGDDSGRRSIYKARCDVGRISTNAIQRWIDEGKENEPEL